MGNAQLSPRDRSPRDQHPRAPTGAGGSSRPGNLHSGKDDASLPSSHLVAVGRRSETLIVDALSLHVYVPASKRFTDGQLAGEVPMSVRDESARTHSVKDTHRHASQKPRTGRDADSSVSHSCVRLACLYSILKAVSRKLFIHLYGRTWSPAKR